MSTEKELLEDLKSIGIKVTSVRDLANAYPNYDQVEPILRKHYKRSKDIHFMEEIKDALRSVEKGLIEDLKKVGISVSSVWDLVNSPNNYKQAESVLIKHFKAAKESRYKEGIVRALGVKGFKNAIRPLIDEFKKSKDESYKWAVANSISIIAPREALDDLIEITGNSKHGSSRQMIAEALGRIGDRKAVPVLIESLKDEDVEGHAVIALGMIGDKSTIEAIKPFLKNKRRWVRKAAKKAIERIKRRNEKVLGSSS